ncbi:hypothetical protein HMPREF1215_00793 [Coprococcus sp. HPP0074]|nr:hypothetical protein HMPREF1215_00793 [Coprococcus sp. HPP0074]
MIKEFCLAWEKSKDKLEKYFRNIQDRTNMMSTEI